MCFVYSSNILRVRFIRAHGLHTQNLFYWFTTALRVENQRSHFENEKKKTYASARAGLVYYTCHRERALLTPNLPTPHSVWRASARSTKYVCFDCCIVATAKFCVCIIMRSNLVRLFVV